VEIKRIEHQARRDGMPIVTYKIRYKETVPDPATGQPTGRTRSRSETYPTYEAAKERRREIENQRAATGNVVGREARQEPFGTFAGMWLDAHAGLVKARTLTEYRRLYEHYVAPEFAARAVGSLTPADARRFRAQLVERVLARGTIKHAWDTFRRILDLAVLDGAIPANPAASVPLPRRNAIGDDEPFAPHPLTSEQVAAVAGHIGARYPVYGLVVLFLAYSGLRTAELAGLEVGDLDLARRTVRVQRTKRKVRGAGTSARRSRGSPGGWCRWTTGSSRTYGHTSPRTRAAATRRLRCSRRGMGATPPECRARRCRTRASTTGTRHSTPAPSTPTTSVRRWLRLGCRPPTPERGRAGCACTTCGTRSPCCRCRPGRTRCRSASTWATSRT
jgi:integrase